MANNTYTITVILKAFFSDCRSQAKIFISEDILTVLDLEKKISRIFGIKDFHLLSNENLLPSCEDIRLLDKGDIVCVVPNEAQENALLPKRFYSSNDGIIEYKSKKRRYLDDECPIKEKKCKKKRKDTTSFTDEKLSNLSENEVNEKLKAFSNEIKRKNKRSKIKSNSNNVLQTEQNLTSHKPQSVKNILPQNLATEKSKRYVLIDKIEESVSKKKIKVGVEQGRNTVQTEEKSTINQMSDDGFGEISQIKITSILDTHISPKSKKLKNVINKEYDSSLSIIVPSSSNSDSETGKAICRKSQYKFDSHMKKSKVLDQSINETEIGQDLMNESIESDDHHKITKKGCSFYHLPVKKRNLWSTSPLQKTINHVKIDKVPITALDIDLSKFVFNPFDAGVIPVPNNETTSKNVRNDCSSSELSMINVSQYMCTSLSSTEHVPIEEIHASAIDTESSEFKAHSNNKSARTQETVERIQQSSCIEQSVPSTLISKNMLESEEIIPLIAEKIINNNDSKNCEEIITKKSIVLKNWKKIIFNKLTADTQNSVLKREETSKSVDEILESNENKQSENTINKSPENSSKVLKLNNDSYRVKKQNTTNQLGVNYYMKLLNKIDWDPTKSISNVNADEIQPLSENERLVPGETPTISIENELNSLANVDMASVSSTVDDFVTKRKRKRKHKKKIRVDTPAIMKSCHFPPTKPLTLVKGAPKIHIRFENEENQNLHVEDNGSSLNVQKCGGNVKVLQDVNLDLSMQSDDNICHIQNVAREEDITGNIPPMCIGDTGKFNPEEYKSECVTILSDDTSTKPNRLDSTELLKENDNAVSSEHLLLNLLDCISNGKNLEHGIQSSALDYTNQNLTSHENTLILNSNSNISNLSKTSQDEALAQAKVALLKAVGFLAPDEHITRPFENVNDSVELINDSAEDVNRDE